jgi:hypothetical protein
MPVNLKQSLYQIRTEHRQLRRLAVSYAVDSRTAGIRPGVRIDNTRYVEFLHRRVVLDVHSDDSNQSSIHHMMS